MNKKVVVGVVIVSYGHQTVLPNLVNLLGRQKRKGDKIAVVDNHPNKKGFESVVNNKAVDFAIRADNNGFSSGCNIGASKLIKFVDVLLFLNPDTLPAKNVFDSVRNADYSHYAAVMPILMLPNKTVNSAGNVVHISGLSWVDGYGQNLNKYTKRLEVSVISGASMAISKTWWNKLGGLPEGYFMYYEDTDFSTRVLLQGGKLGLLTNTYIEHDYDFGKGTHKWLYIERNRLLYIIRTWPASVIAVLSIQLLFVEIGLWVVAIFDKRLGSKLKATGMTIKSIPSAIKDRHFIQKSRAISGYDFLQTLTYKLDTPLLGKIGNNSLVKFIYSTYYWVCLLILKLFNGNN